MLESLFSPVSIGTLELPNRVVMPPMTTRYADDEGYATDTTVNYYRERARGGTGLLIMEGTQPVQKLPKRHHITDDKYIPALQRVTDAVHEAGGLITSQLLPHRGTDDELNPLAPSPLTTPDGEDVPAITKDGLQELIEEYGEGARRAYEAGFDAIEIHGATGYLLQMFMSPATNHRGDEYGGSLENRTRFARELLQVTRENTSDSFPVWFRICGNEFFDDGIDPAEANRIAKRLAEAGSDAIHVRSGHIFDTTKLVMSGYEPRGVYLDHAERIRQDLDVPLIGNGRINDPEFANDAIADGKADLVSMGRAHIADPHFVRKAKAGNLDRIRRCVGDLKGCRDLVNGNPVTCTVNVMVGREGEEIPDAETPKTVAVVGGGPAGLETARWAAKRGHSVTVYEREDEIGGQLRWGQHAPGKHEYVELLRFFRAELEAYGVDVRTEHEVTTNELSAAEADEVVIATGSGPVIPSIEGISGGIAADRVTTPELLLADETSAYDTPVVYGGTEIGCDVAEYIGERGIDVTIVAPETLVQERLSEEEFVLQTTSRDKILKRLDANDHISIRREARLTAIAEDHVTVTQDGETLELDCDKVILAQAREPERNLDPSAIDVPVRVIGDADAVGGLYSAIHEGADVGQAL